ncbi:hypothetical protein SNF32_03465 [Enterococcus mundtii]|nr:hypothetical protein [Enterococcus mundtii]
MELSYRYQQEETTIFYGETFVSQLKMNRLIKRFFFNEPTLL